VEPLVLLDDDPAVVVDLLQHAEDRGEVDVALSEGLEHARVDALGPRGLPGDHRLGDRGVDVLEVDMTDPVAQLLRDRHRVAATAEDVPDVQAEVDAGALEHAGDVFRGLDGGSDVRVQDAPQAACAARLVDCVQAGEQFAPFLLGQFHSLVEVAVRADRPDRRDGRADAGEEVGGPVELRDHLVDRTPREYQRGPTGHAAQGVGVEQSQRGRGIGREQTRLELGRLQLRALHVGEHLLGGKLDAPAREVVDPPRHGLSAQTICQMHHKLISVDPRSY